MIIEDIFDEAIDKGASDIHIVVGMKPMVRVARELIELESFNKVTEESVYEFYDYMLRGSIEKDETFNETKKLDSSLEYGDTRFRVNISLSNGVPVFTLRLIKKDLPKYEDLGVPDIVRRLTLQTQGLLLVTGKTNSGKTTTLNALVNEINETINKKILTLENPVEYKHECKKSLIVQKKLVKVEMH